MNNSIIPSIWFDQNAKEAFDLYAGTFPGSHISNSSPIVVEAVLSGVKFIGINGGPTFKPNPSISFMVICESKEEIDRIWNSLAVEGNTLMPLNSYPLSPYYGWLADKFSVNWQLYLGKLSDTNQQAIVPTLMYCGEQQGNCEQALAFYAELFHDFRSNGIMKYTEGEYTGSIQHSQFLVRDFTLMAMDSGVPQNFTFNEGISLTILCKDQQEIDYFWNTITKKGKESMCGWCKDEFGVSWQIVPEQIATLLKRPGANEALIRMKKIIIQELIG
ncbi:VOC family protein [Sphingobacterium multivorum]|jgi:predicted 3-demethylubiquinone-9 3-methyltransferase (glyoxalase superfamily)|uniref:VOC family protein n=1 Tax=Sphingobacterium multivorum TaxID=28454 RepID=UPI001918B2A3|nr:VOC family protein [Sphingobacterium multivorum]QQT60161.1 VOC family protein [Sphingobacterium multivorum]